MTSLNSNKPKKIVVRSIKLFVVVQYGMLLVKSFSFRRSCWIAAWRFPCEAQAVTTAEAAAAFGYVSSPSLAKQINRLQGHVGVGSKLPPAVFGKKFPTPVDSLTCILTLSAE